jgi:hypothetical protein
MNNKKKGKKKPQLVALLWELIICLFFKGKVKRTHKKKGKKTIKENHKKENKHECEIPKLEDKELKDPEHTSMWCAVTVFGWYSLFCPHRAEPSKYGIL